MEYYLSLVISLKVLVTGGCGFIGSHLVDSLVSINYHISIIDNLSNGYLGNISKHLDSDNISFINADLKEFIGWPDKFKDIDIVFHLAANPEVRPSITKPIVHFRENVLATFNVLEACRRHGIKHLVFASSSTVYGDAKIIPTSENYFPLEPISVYGSCKLACEDLIVTYSKLYSIKSLIIRYANIIGPRSNHGVIIDFINKLRNNPLELEILGDGSQRKSYLHVYDAVDAILHLFDVFKKSGKEYDVFNVGNEDWITVKEIADIISEEMDLKNVKYRFKPATPDGRGWLGDVKFMLLDISKLKSTGWKPKWNSYEAVRKTVRQILGKEKS